MAGEYYPVASDLGGIANAAIESVADHWHGYFSLPEEQRLGDEHTWDVLLPNTLVEIGFDRERAQELSTIGKLDAQLRIQR